MLIDHEREEQAHRQSLDGWRALAKRCQCRINSDNDDRRYPLNQGKQIERIAKNLNHRGCTSPRWRMTRLLLGPPCTIIRYFQRVRNGGSGYNRRSRALQPAAAASACRCCARGGGCLRKRTCPCGGIGRRARLKIEFRKECRFDSGRGHQLLDPRPELDGEAGIGRHRPAGREADRVDAGVVAGRRRVGVAGAAIVRISDVRRGQGDAAACRRRAGTGRCPARTGSKSPL